MILQALVRHYEDLEAKGEIAPLGWAPSDVSFAICLGDDGQVEQIISIKTMQTSGKKSVLRPQRILLPLVAEGRTSTAVRPNFIWDNAGYLLGLNTKGDTARGVNCFLACKSFHNTLLSGCSSPAVKALLAFFEHWKPEKAADHPAVVPIFDQLKGGNLVFRYHGAYLHKDDQIKSAWDSYYASAKAEEEEMVCLVTGKRQPVARLHPQIKGIFYGDAKATLVSFNADAFCSYGKEKNNGMNAPVGKYAAFAYTTALNHLLADREHVLSVGDTTVVCWAEGGQSVYQDIFAGFFGDRAPHYTERELREKVKALLSGSQVNVDSELDPNKPFYILGLAPNTTRLSVRFFFRNSFGQFLRNVQRHYERLEIIRPEYEKAPGSIWRLIFETQRKIQKSDDNSSKSAKKPDEENSSKGTGKLDAELKKLSADLLYSILTDGPYPAAWLSKILARIRSEQTVTSAKAAILKAYILKNSKNFKCKEVARVSLNVESDYFPYVWGRIFSVFENIQLQSAQIDNPGAKPNATIKSRFFNAASTTPEQVYPTLERLKNSHMDKLEKQRPALYLSFSKQLTELFSKLSFPFPKRLNNEEQVAFFLGYYHQTQKRYEKKEENENV